LRNISNVLEFDVTQKTKGKGQARRQTFLGGVEARPARTTRIGKLGKAVADGAAVSPMEFGEVA